jgi:quinoprotein glucose dehydrogenase
MGARIRGFGGFIVGAKALLMALFVPLFMTLLISAIGISAPPAGAATANTSWEYWGGDADGTRFSPLAQITPGNVDQLIEAWHIHTGDLARPPELMARTKFEVTPLLVDDSLIICTPFNDVIALDPGTGAQKWRYDLHASTGLRPANRWNCRGLAFWRDDQAAADAVCAHRVFMGTNDARVIALDPRSGRPCPDFGHDGEVRLDPGMKLEWPGEYQITSAPVVGHGVVVVGSSIADNERVDAPLGAVHALDARTGASRWQWDPLIHDGVEAGQANVWAPMSVDEATGLLFLPTSSASPDFWGGKRPGNNENANSVVALKIETGELVWAFQTVHHDVWDYDLPAQPTLARLDTGDGVRDVVIQASKQGFLFVLDRATGKPIWPVEERAALLGGAEGERLSPTQPYPTHVPTLVPQSISPDDAYGLIPFWDRAACRKEIAAARNEGLFTPPSTKGTLLFPMTGGGVNWGGVAFDPVRQILYANTTRAIHKVTLIPRDAASSYVRVRGVEFGQQRGAPFAMTRAIMLSPLGMPCNKPPWGAMVAVDLKAGKILWQASVGTSEDRAPLGLALNTGSPLLSGVLVTQGGVVFTGATDSYLRAFDAATGAELWQGRLPVPAVANPMTYLWNGQQYVVIAAGGHSEAGTTIGDSLVAFRLAGPGEAPSLRSRTIDRPGGRFLVLMTTTLAVVVVLVAALTWRRRTGRNGAA